MRTRLGRTIVAYLWIGTLALVCGIPAVLGALARLRSEARAESAAGPAPAADVAPVRPERPRPDAVPAFEAPAADHNETANDGMKGDSQQALVSMAGPGHNQALGVGAGGGGGGAGGGRVFAGRRGGGAAAPMPAAGDLSGRSEEYHGLPENPFVPVAGSEPSTFSIDVDTASWTNIRRIVGEGRLPHRDAVRIEEMLNAFRYDDAPPRDGAPFAVSAEVHPAPWNREHRLVRIGLRAKDVDLADAPPANLVFLIDVSGSMADELKLPLVKRCLRLMVDRLREQDKVSLVTYAGVSGLVLEATPGSQKAAILAAIDRLGAGGSTNGAAGIHEAYAAALRHFVKGGINRVLLCTDGDFNVGISTRESLGDLIAAKRETGVFLSVMGFGRGNLADARMQELAEKGNGQAAYIDTFGEGRRVFAEQLTGTLLTVAKDVKIQVEFNAGQAESARLIGYESRMLAAKDFRDDAKDAGEIGAGHQVVALYEVVPAAAASGTSLCTIRLRFKPADGETSSGFECDLDAAGTGKPSAEFDFACAIAACGMLLKDSAHRGTANWGMVQELAEGGIGGDRSGARREFVSIVREMRRIATPQQHVTAPERDR